MDFLVLSFIFNSIWSSKKRVFSSTEVPLVLSAKCDKELNRGREGIKLDCPLVNTPLSSCCYRTQENIPSELERVRAILASTIQINVSRIKYLIS